jgi:hypothetical protein
MSATHPTALKICYRADFEGPHGALNPSGWKVPGIIGVEVRKCGAHWKAYRPGTAHEFTEITPQAEASTIKDQTPLLFDRKLSDWQMYELTEPSGKAVPLTADEVWTDKKGRIYRK